MRVICFKLKFLVQQSGPSCKESQQLGVRGRTSAAQDAHTPRAATLDSILWPQNFGREEPEYSCFSGRCSCVSHDTWGPGRDGGQVEERTRRNLSCAWSHKVWGGRGRGSVLTGTRMYEGNFSLHRTAGTAQRFRASGCLR